MYLNKKQSKIVAAVILGVFFVVVVSMIRGTGVGSIIRTTW